MKYYIILAILIINSLLAFPNYSDDFGFRLSLGGISGINNKVYPEVSAVTHFYCFSNNFRMVFGPTAIISTDIDTPSTVLHQIGFEYNQTINKIPIIIGIRYYKSFIHDDNFEFDGGKNGWIILVGAKKQLSANKNIVFMVGWLDQVLRHQDAENDQLDNQQIQIETGIEWLF